MSGQTVNYIYDQGETFLETLRWATTPYITKAVTGVTAAAPPVLTVTAHGMPDGWPCAAASLGGMTQLNTKNYPPRGSDWRQGTVSNANTVAFNEVDATRFDAFTSGGFLVYPTPVDMAGMTATFNVYDNAEHTGTPLVALTQTSGITIDNTAKTIMVTFVTAGATWTTGYFRLRLTDTQSVVKELIEGVITLV